MIYKFLRAKHWQLFALTFGVPMIFYVAMMVTVFSQIANTNGPDPSLMLNSMIFFPFIMIISMGTHFGWLWSIAIGLQNKIPSNVNLKIKKFKVFFFIPLIYIIFISIFIGFFMNTFALNEEAPNPELILGAFAFIIPIHLFSMFCIFYSLYFVAKTYKTAELQREANFSDFAGEFFLIWFYAIGVWIIQPKINKMIEE